MPFVGTRHVVEYQHETGNRQSANPGTMLTIAAEHGRHVRAQQAPGTRGGDKLRRPDELPALLASRLVATGLLQTLERMLDQRPIENGVDRTSQPESAAVSAARKFLLCPLVVQEYATVEVADHDTLAQLGHQRRQTAALLLERRARFVYPLGDILFERVANGQQLIGRLSQHPQFWGTLLGQAQPIVGNRRRQLFGHTQRCGDVKCVQSDQRPTADRSTSQDHDDENHDPLFGRSAAAALAGLTGQHQARRRNDQNKHEQADRHGCQYELARGIHRLHPQQFAHLGEQFLGREGLGHVTVGPEPETLADLGIAPLGSQHQDARAAQVGVGPQGLADIEPVHARHHHVEQDEIGSLGTHPGQRFLPITGHQHLEALAAQQKLDRDDNVLLVVGNQYFFAHQHSDHH